MEKEQIKNMYEIIKYCTYNNLKTREKIYGIKYINKDYFVEKQIEKFNKMYNINQEVYKK